MIADARDALTGGSMPERYRRWFEYEKESHAKVLESLRSVPESERGDARFGKAVDLFAHLVAARWLWLHRLGQAEEPGELFPQGVKLARLAVDLERVQAAWDDYLEALDEVELRRPFEYASYEGDYFRNQVDDALTQLFGHSMYHRGQIAALVRDLGHEPAATDYIFWTRQLLTS